MNRERIDYYIKRYEIPFREDESNASDQFLRNRIRKNILPFLKKEGLDPSHLWKNFHDGFDELWKPYTSITEPDRILLDRSFFNATPDIVKNVLDASLKRLSLPPVTLSVIHEISAQMTGEPSRIHLITGNYIIWSAETGPVWIFRRDSSLLKSFIVTKEGSAEKYTIRYGRAEKTYAMPDSCHVTVRQDGMRMEIKGGSKKIKKILQESHIPVEIRDHIPLIVSRDTGRVLRVCLSLIEGYKDRVSEVQNEI